MASQKEQTESTGLTAAAAADGETEYTAIDPRRRLIFGPWHGLLGAFVHLPALAMTGAILWLHYSKIFWFEEEGITGVVMVSANNILNALQLLAKIYEICIVASLAHITVKTFKRALLDKGLPAGIVTGGYRVGDLSYLASSRFWVSMGGAFFLALFLAFNTILSLLVGPASAILIVPELGWFPVRQPFVSGAMPVLMWHPRALWPEVLPGVIVGNATACSEEEVSYRLECPAAGFAPLYTWAAGWATAGLPDQILFPDHTGKTTRRLDMHTGTTGTFATVPMSLMASTVGQLQLLLLGKRFMGRVSSMDKYKLDLKPDETKPIWQPLVQAKCFVWNFERPDGAPYNLDTNQTMGAGPDFNCYNDNENSNCHRTRRVIHEHMRRLPRPLKDNDTRVGVNAWVNGPGESDYDDEGLPLTSFLFSARLPTLIGHNHGNVSMGSRHVACGTMSHWVPTTFGIDPSTTDQINTNITEVSLFAKENGYRDATGGGELDRVVHFNRSWVPFINPRSNVNREVLEDKDEGQQDDAASTAVSYRSSKMTTLLSAFLLGPFSNESNSNGTTIEAFIGPGSGEGALEESADEEVRWTMERLVAAVTADAISRTMAVLPFGPLMVLPSNLTPGAKTMLDLRNVNPRKSWRQAVFFPNGSIFDENGDLVEHGDEETGRFPQEVAQNFTGLDFAVQRFGYGYGHVGGTSTFALAVIYAYLAVLLAYILIVAVTGSDAVDAWGDLQDLMALAWSSPSPPEVVGNGSGIKTRRFWRKTVAIRASASGVVTMGLSEDQSGFRKLERGKKYR